MDITTLNSGLEQILEIESIEKDDYQYTNSDIEKLLYEIERDISIRSGWNFS